MPITFACQCGKQLCARDDLASRRVACPTCNDELVVPTPWVESPVQSGSEPPPFPKAVMLSELSTEQAKRKNSLWMDPVVVFGAAIPSLILIAFFAYLYQQYKARE